MKKVPGLAERVKRVQIADKQPELVLEALYSEVISTLTLIQLVLEALYPEVIQNRPHSDTAPCAYSFASL